MRLRRLLHRWRTDRRGVAIEMAILMLVVSFSLSVMLTTTSLLQYNKRLAAEKEIVTNTVTEQIGESFCSAVKNGSGNSWIAMYPDYDITVEGLTLTVKEKGSENVLLSIELSLDEATGKYRVVKWKKGV